MCMFCRSLFVLLSFFFWPLCCLFFFNIRIMITPLVSSNTSYTTIHHRNLKIRLKEIIHNRFFFKHGKQRYKFIVLGQQFTYFVKHESKSKMCYTENEAISSNVIFFNKSLALSWQQTVPISLSIFSFTAER